MPVLAIRYNMNFNGEAGCVQISFSSWLLELTPVFSERAVVNSDNMGDLIPASADYAQHGTTFFYCRLTDYQNILGTDSVLQTA